MAVATEKGTIHVFATNPYGGPADEQSHLTGRVVNPKEVVCDFSFRVLLYCVSLTASSSSRCRPNCMLSFAFECRSLRHRRWYQYRWHSLFFRSLCSCRPPCFLCAFSPARFQQQLDRLTDVLSSSNHSYQDVLLFNPREGSLSLRRVILSKQARDRLSSGLSAVPLPGGHEHLASWCQYLRSPWYIGPRGGQPCTLRVVAHDGSIQRGWCD